MTLVRLLLTAVLLSASVSAQKDEVQRKIDSLLTLMPSQTDYSIYITDPLTREVLYSYNQKEPMVPASNTKLYTTAVALYVMGPDYELSTTLYTDDTILTDGEINGSLYIKGYGNSRFKEEHMDEWVSRLKSLGIDKVTGGIIGDDSFFDNEYTRKDWIENELTDVNLQAVSALVMDNNRTIVKRKRRGRWRRYYINVSNPPYFIAEQLKEKLEEAEITVEGGVASGFTPESVAEIAKQSITLLELIRIVNKFSHNFAAECLFKTIGAVATNSQGSAINGAQTVHNFLKDNDLYKPGINVVDGSGLSRYNYLTTEAVAALLEKIYIDLDKYDMFVSTLAVAGVDGTLHDRMTGGRAENNFRGKTGTLNGVSTLSGFLVTGSGDELIVSMFMRFNSKGANFYREIQDRIIEALCEYSAFE